MFTTIYTLPPDSLKNVKPTAAAMQYKNQRRHNRLTLNALQNAASDSPKNRPTRSQTRQNAWQKGRVGHCAGNRLAVRQLENVMRSTPTMYSNGAWKTAATAVTLQTKTRKEERVKSEE